ncbi:MAG: PLP-dependent aspartate aminotransferase family protein [Pseudomonadota bacterium]
MPDQKYVEQADPLSIETDVVQGMQRHDTATGAVMPAIHPATTYARDADNQLLNAAHCYTRDENPTYDLPETMLARLERGAAAMLFSSGMAAGAAVFRALKPGDHVVLPSVMYFALRDWVHAFADTWGLAVSEYTPGDNASLQSAIRANATRLVWLETPSNPMWHITDIAAAAEFSHAAGALLAVDSTVATPVHTQPLTLGADIVMHSATKALNGHSDVLAGALVTREVTKFWGRIATERGLGGAIPGPFEAWLLQRGMRTLFVRVQRASANASAIAHHFDGHRALRAVLYPGLPHAQGHAIARRQMRDGFGALLSFRFSGGRAAALRVLGRLQRFSRATSLGGVESLVEHRASAESGTSPVPDDLLRFSIGIERVEDLIADLEHALDAE